MRIHHTYLSLPDDLYTILDPIGIDEVQPFLWNESLIEELGLSSWIKKEASQVLLSGRSTEHPRIAQAYAGHQYGHFTILGDGRAMLLGELETSRGMIDLHLKGAGRTPYSRQGDGKATLSSMLREHVIGEAMHHLGIPTTRSLAVFRTNETVLREQAHQGAMLVRVAASHLRVGTFEYARILDDISVLSQLTEYAMLRHAPHLTDKPDRILDFFTQVVLRQADLIAKWQSNGFVHGVMNTDNTTISGETIDYGPCAFLDAYDPGRSYSSIDHSGRYAYGRQPYIASWNLSKLAVSLLPLVHKDVETGISMLNQALSKFQTHYEQRYRYYMGRKLGLDQATPDDDALIRDFLGMLERHGLDFTNSFVHLGTGTIEDAGFPFVEWTTFEDRWHKRLADDGSLADARKRLKQANPVVIPRNHIVERAVREADFQNDDALLRRLLKVLEHPFDYDADIEPMFLEGDPTGRRFVSYCGT
jgi:uncharacterized protein YdiU (UPF0061 family)